MIPPRRARLFDFLSPGAWIIIAAAVVTAVVHVLWPAPKRDGRDFWMFSTPNVQPYRTLLNAWNAAHPDNRVNLVPIHYQALERRLVAAFTSDAPVADLVETESLAMARALFDSERL